MDHKIYGYLPRTDLGVYGTRRYPKGQIATPSEPARVENRNPVPIDLQFGTPNATAHAQVERWRYTVPINRMAHLITAGTECMRVVAGGPTPQANSMVNIKRAKSAGPGLGAGAGVNGVVQTFLRSTLTSGSVGGMTHDYLSGNADVLLFEGDILIGSTAVDAGTVHLLCFANLLEFDSTEHVREAFSAGSTTFNPIVGNGGLNPLSAPQSGGGAGGFKTIIRVEGGSGPFYRATGWTDLGGGYFGRN